MLHRPTTAYGMIAESASKLGEEMENWHKTFRQPKYLFQLHKHKHKRHRKAIT